MRIVFEKEACHVFSKDTAAIVIKLVRETFFFCIIFDVMLEKFKKVHEITMKMLKFI